MGIDDRYQVLVEDIISGHIACDRLDVATLKYDDYLNRPGSLELTVPMGSPHATEALLREGQLAAYVMRDGRIEQGGPMWDIAVDVDKITVKVEGWLGYWDHRVIETDYQPDGVDQFAIVDQLVADAQDEGQWGTGYDLGITVDYDAPSGVTRQMIDSFRPWHTKNLGAALRELAGLPDGFDFSMAYALENDRITKTIRLHHPRRGRDTGHLFEYVAGQRSGNNITRYKWSRSASRMAWAGKTWGAGNDDERISSSRYVDETRRGSWPPLTAAPGLSGVTEQPTIEDHATAAFVRSSAPLRLPTITVDANLNPRWSDYGLGDTVRVRINDRYAQIDAREFRFVGFEMDAATDTPELTLEEDLYA